jgi:hypothetical protein
MTSAIELYGTLILTLVSFIIPVLTILLSLFPQGTKSLMLKYENERKQSDENIASETKKRETEKGLDYKALEKTLKSLEKKRAEAKLKLEYLQPSKLFIRTSLPFMVAFIGDLIALFNLSTLEAVLFIVCSILAFAAGIMTLFNVITVLFEVGEIVNKTKNSNEEKMIELLSILVEKSGDNLYLKDEEIRVIFNNVYLKKDEKIDFSINSKHEIPISIHNSSEKMAKNVEVGLIFPKDVLIEKTPNLTVFADESSQIVRFNKEMIQSHENNMQGDLQITFLKSEEIKIEIFIKGENVKYKRFSFNLNIVK